MRPPRRNDQKPPATDARGPTELVAGLYAGLAVFATRQGDIVRVAYARTVRPRISGLARWASSRAVPCVDMGEAELDRFAGGAHHEGLCIETLPRHWLSTQDLTRLLLESRGVAIALDRIRNPYNVGAVLRSAAFFGLEAAVLGAPAPHPGLAPTAVRVAEGGVEHLGLARTTDLAATLARLRARGIRVVGADVQTAAGGPVAHARPVVLVIGNEREGLDARVRAQCDALVCIPGRGAMESLNVAVAAGILLATITRPPP
jgi:RNA methyltransferase, TrmH family